MLCATFSLQAELTFKQYANKDGLVSQLDVIAIVRSMGMNPTDAELTELIDVMQIRDAEKEKQVWGRLDSCDCRGHSLGQGADAV